MRLTRRASLLAVIALLGAFGLAGCGKKNAPALSGIPVTTTTSSTLAPLATTTSTAAPGASTSVPGATTTSTTSASGPSSSTTSTSAPK